MMCIVWACKEYGRCQEECISFVSVCVGNQISVNKITCCFKSRAVLDHMLFFPTNVFSAGGNDILFMPIVKSLY